MGSHEVTSFLTRVKITPTMLKWARERVGLDYANAAQKIGVKPEVIQSWERGESAPTFRQLEKLSKTLHVPLGYLFLSQPPQTVSAIPDFRSLPHSRLGRFSPDLEAVLNDARRKQAWLREWRIEESVAPLDFIGKFSLKDPPELIAENIRSTLNLPYPTAYRLKNWQEHLHRLVEHAEKTGIVVIRNGVVLSNNHRPLNLEEFRGFNLRDEYAPLVFINAQDSIAGQIFTLSHELAHLWIGEEGISNPFTVENPIHLPEIERFCNRIAAELLVPKRVFLEKWGLHDQSIPAVLNSAQQFAEEFKVSTLVILLRAYELDVLDEPIFRATYQEAFRNLQRVNDQKKGGGNFFATWQARNSETLVSEVFSALQQGRALYLESARLLNTNIATLEKAFARYKQGRL